MTAALDQRGRVRVAVTGLGVKTPAGNDLETFWQTLAEARSRAATLTNVDASEWQVRFGCEVRDFDPTAYVSNKEARRLDRVTQLGLAASVDALAHAGDLHADPARCAVVIGTGIGGLQTLEDQVSVYLTKGPMRVSPFFVPMMRTRPRARSRCSSAGPVRTCASRRRARRAATQWAKRPG
jgi:3-oxoacyl-[acyl-carrier-protein] synthase II